MTLAFRIGLGIATGLLLVLLFPAFSFTFLAPVALTPLLTALAREPVWWRRALIGEICGLAFWFGVCHWIQWVLAYHGAMGELGGWGSFLVFCVLKALHMALFSILAGPLLRRWWATLAIPAWWVGLEQTHGPFGFPWLALGNAGLDMSLPMRLAPWTGVYGLSFVFALMATAVAFLLLRRPRRELAPFLLLPLLYLLPPLPALTKPREHAIVVQTNVPQDAPRWTPDAMQALIGRVSRMTLEAALAPRDRKAALLVWPESPAPFYFPNDQNLVDETRRIARLTRTPLLFGAVSFSPRDNPLNSSFLLSQEGQLAGRYEKMYLVPFGEFVPPVFWWVNRITQEAGDFEPGQNLKVMRAGDHNIGVFICYESAFPHFVREFAYRGGEVLVNLTNDGYFGRSAARQQHLWLARMRAAENRRWILRPTNDGYTVSIDPAGRVIDELPPFTATAGALGFNWSGDKTFYTQHGDWFAWLCLAAALAAAAATRFVPQYGRE